jgi:hypothetical protein
MQPTSGRSQVLLTPNLTLHHGTILKSHFYNKTKLPKKIKPVCTTEALQMEDWREAKMSPWPVEASPST